MPPFVALLLWLVLLLALLCWDPARDSKISVALWVPLIWIFIVASRLPSQWLGSGMGQVAAALQEGNPLDATIYTTLIAAAVGILISRSFNWSGFFARNLALTAFLLFAMASVLWSDFPFVTFKRWFRDLGNYLVILVVLSDPRELGAVSALLRRLSYLLITLSFLLIKYYPQIGMQYEYYNGNLSYVGPTTSKNMLGVLCLISGLFFFWDTVMRWSNRTERRTRRIILVNVVFIAMTLWLLNLASSATSTLCLALGWLVIAVAHCKTIKRHPVVLKTMIPLVICLYLVLMCFGIDFNALVTGAVGRDSTFTGRTNIWNAVLSTHTNPVVGTGYDSFWLGQRLEKVWRQAGPVNEAHNGYLEIYLNLGLIGLLLVVGFLIASYQTSCKLLTLSPSAGSLPLALWTILLFYNVTEAAFKGQLMWVIFLLGVIVAPPGTKSARRSPAARSSFEEPHPIYSRT